MTFRKVIHFALVSGACAVMSVMTTFGMAFYDYLRPGPPALGWYYYGWPLAMYREDRGNDLRGVIFNTFLADLAIHFLILLALSIAYVYFLHPVLTRKNDKPANDNLDGPL